MPAWSSVAVVVYVVACAVWALILFGAWVGSLNDPPRLLKPFGLRKEYADRVMNALVHEVVVLVAAIAILAGSFFNSVSTREKTEEVIADLLSTVSGESTPLDVVNALRTLSALPTELQRTAQAYVAYLDEVSASGRSPPNTQNIEASLPKTRGAFDLRLLGLANDFGAEHAPEPADPAAKRKMFEMAQSYYQRALEALPSSGKRMGEAAMVRFSQRTLSTLAGVDLSLGDLADDETERKKLLESAVGKYQKLGGAPLWQVPVNLAGTYSLLGKYDPLNYRRAIEALASIHTRALSRAERELAFNSALDLDRMHEFNALALRIEDRVAMPWKEFIAKLRTNGIQGLGGDALERIAANQAIAR